MKIPADVREAMGSPAPGVEFQMRPVQDVADVTNRPRAEIISLIQDSLCAGLLKVVNNGNVKTWILEPDESLPPHLIRMALINNRATQDLLPGAQTSHTLVRFEDIDEADRDDVTAWVKANGGSVVTHTFAEPDDTVGPGGEFPRADLQGTVSIIRVPTDALSG